MRGPSSAVDLRDAFGRHLGRSFWMPTEGEQTGDQDHDDQGADHDGQQEDHDQDHDQEQVEGDAQEGTGDEEEAEQRRKLSQEAKKWRRKLREAETRLRDLEGTAGAKDEGRSLRLRLAFERAAGTAYLEDLDAAWKLAEEDLKVVDVQDDGTVDTDRLGDVVAHVAHRYPYLVQEEERPPSATTHRLPLPAADP